jgi:hypothetical protein
MAAWYDEIGKFLGSEAGAGSLAGLGLLLAQQGYKDIGDIGSQAYREMSGPDGLAQELRGMLEFQPYTVTTATGGQFGMQQDPTTGQMAYQMQMSPEEQAIQQQLLSQAQQMYGQAAMPTADREQEVFQRMMTAMSPEQERERLALEQRLAAQGRLGTQTAQFGGTPEGLTLAKAQEEARNTAMLNAMQFAGQEQMQQAQLGQGMLSGSYIPQAQLIAGLQPGMTGAEQRRASLSEQARTYGETYATGLEALLQAGLGQAGIAGGFGTQLAGSALGGLFKKEP